MKRKTSARARMVDQSVKGENQPMNTDKVYEAVCGTLRNIPLGEYEDEETQLQPYLQTEISRALENASLDKYEIKISIGGRNKPKVDLLGTNFWPDIEISTNGEPFLAVEVKLAQKSLAGAISGTIGQCLIYKLKYKYVIGFIKNQARINPHYNEFDARFEEMLNRMEFPLIIRS
jgi:hypothetical protein